MLNTKKPVLVLAPHTDDGEFGCGGTISKLIKQERDVYYIAFSSCEASVPEGMPKDTLKTEAREATARLGISESKLIFMEFPVRHFPQNRQDILEEMVKLSKELDPGIVFLPSTSDTHQDHQVVSQEGFRAFKKCTILGYEAPWNNLTFHTSCFSRLEENDLISKVEALKLYKSQHFRSYASEEFIYSLAKVRGTQIGCSFAEAFEAIRWILD